MVPRLEVEYSFISNRAEVAVMTENGRLVVVIMASHRALVLSYHRAYWP